MSEKYDVPYMRRTRDYYRAQGYSSDYQWAHHDDTPFAPPAKPLNQCRVGVITTAMPDTESGRSSRQVYSSPCTPLPDSMYTSELSWHQSVTHTSDLGSFLPLEHLQAMASDGTIGELAPRFHSVPTEYSQRNTCEKDAPELLKRLQEDEVDIALLIPL